MKTITKEVLDKEENLFIYIYTPFCGTCHLARTILNQIEQGLKKQLFYEMNGSYFEKFLHEQKIESVPCLLMKVNGTFIKKIYTFFSLPNMLSEIANYDISQFEIK